MEELTKQEEIEAIRQAQAEKLTPAQLKEELETEEALEELYQKAKLMVFEVGPERQGNPTAIVTGGQPGAGKSGLVKLAVQRFKESYNSLNLSSSISLNPSRILTSAGSSKSITNVSGLSAAASLESTGLMQYSLTASNCSSVKSPFTT